MLVTSYNLQSLSFFVDASGLNQTKSHAWQSTQETSSPGHKEVDLQTLCITRGCMRMTHAEEDLYRTEEMMVNLTISNCYFQCNR